MTQPEENPTSTVEVDYDHAAIERAVATAVRRALLDHKRARNPIAALRDGKVVWIPPESIDDGTRPAGSPVP